MGINDTGIIQYRRNLKSGERNLITDVQGVLVGHKTLYSKKTNAFTGVTAVLPHQGNLFLNKLPAAAHVINGFGKSVGLMQVNELGVLETPILLTNTFAIGTCTNALVKHMLAENHDIGNTTGTVNPVIFECNDGYLNDIRAMHVCEQDVFDALSSASRDFQEGSVGAGTGMSCYSLKGGIGSSSRVVDLDGCRFTVGALLLTNFGSLRDLTIYGKKIGEQISALKTETDKGSVIILLATDIPLSHRQLMRAARRAQNGLARTGSITGSGSGEIVLAFSTATLIPHYKEGSLLQSCILHEEHMDTLFQAVGECVEESVYSSMLHADRLVGRDGHVRNSLGEFLSNFH